MTKSPKLIQSLCDNCSKCCEYINILIKEPKTKRAIDKVVWYLLHGVSLHIDRDGDWMIHLPNRCKALDDKGRCTIYSTRPTICREYSQMKCEKYDKKYGDRYRFNDEKEFLRFVMGNPKLKSVYSKGAR